MFSRTSLGAIQVLRNAGGGGGVSFLEKKRYECVRFNVISVTSGWVGVKFPGKCYVTLEWPLIYNCHCRDAGFSLSNGRGMYNGCRLPEQASESLQTLFGGSLRLQVCNRRSHR